MKRCFWLPVFLLGVSLLAKDRPVAATDAYFPSCRQADWTYVQKSMETAVVNVHLKDNRLINYFSAGKTLDIGFGVHSVFLSDSGARFPLYDFSAECPWALPRDILKGIPCVDSSTLAIVERDVTVITPAGEFSGCVRVLWDPPCMDAGILEEVFAPGVGLVKRVEARIYGVSVWELYSATLDERHVGPQELELDCSVYPYLFAETFHILCTLRSGSRAVSLTFPDGQTYEIVARDPEGNVIYTWSEGKDFSQSLTELEITAEAPFSFEEKIKLPVTKDGIYWVEVSLPVSAVEGIDSTIIPMERLWVMKETPR